jgi:hypothetical protein
MLIYAHGRKELPTQLYRANVSQQSSRQRTLPYSQNCLPMAGLLRFDRQQRSQLSPRLRSSGAHEAYSEQSSKISDFTSIQRGLARRQQYVTRHRPDEPTRKAGSRDLAR